MLVLLKCTDAAVFLPMHTANSYVPIKLLLNEREEVGTSKTTVGLHSPTLLCSVFSGAPPPLCAH